MGLLAAHADAQFRPVEATPGEDYHIELGYRFWSPSPDILLGSGDLALLSQTGVDFVREFNIQDKRFNEFRTAVRGGKHKLRLSHLNIEYNQAAQLQRTVVFGGRTFTVNADATADLQWEMWRIGYEYDLYKASRGYFGVFGEMNFNHVVANLHATAAGSTVSSLTDEKAPVPAVGIVGRAYPHRNIAITAEYSGFKMPKFLAKKINADTNADVHVRDLDIYVTGSITRYLGIEGGYRTFTTSYLFDEDSGDLGLKGPYFGLLVRF